VGYAFAANQIIHRMTFHRLRLQEHVSLQPGNTTDVLEGLTSRLTDAGLPQGQAEDGALQILDNTVTRHATMLAHNDVFWMLALLFVLSLPLLGLLGHRPRHATPAPAQSTPQRA
jgi:DHA2 family multidrug resistance protein